MQTLITKRPGAAGGDVAVAAAQSARLTRSDNNLVSLASPVLGVIMRVRAGQVKPSNDLRRTIDELLKEMEQRGAMLRYPDVQVQSVKFALASFVDETVLTNDFPLRDEWEKYPLQLQYFGEHLAGVKYFERLDELVKNPEANAEVIEVYYLCMLLGYKGKYGIYMEEQLRGVISQTAEHLRNLGRLQRVDLSPHWRVMDQPEPPRDPGLPLWFKIGSGATIGILILFYMIVTFLLSKNVEAARDQLTR